MDPTALSGYARHALQSLRREVSWITYGEDSWAGDEVSVPFNVGDPAAKFELVADAVRVFSTKVVEVGRGYVIDEQGQRHEFDAAGESPDIVPMDNELAVELMVRGEGFTVS